MPQYCLHRRFRTRFFFVCILILSSSISIFVFFGHRLLHNGDRSTIDTPIFVKVQQSETCREFWSRSFNIVRRCLQKSWSIKDDQKIDSCIGWNLGNRLNISPIFPEIDELDNKNKILNTQYFINPKLKNPQAPIFWKAIKKSNPIFFMAPKLENMPGTFLSLGLQNGGGQEIEIKRKYGHWEFYALDQNSAQNRYFDSIGTFYNFTLINSSTPEFGTLRQIGARRRKARNIPFADTIEFIDFLSLVIRKYAIDYLLIRSESMAAIILQQLIPLGAMERNGVAICQLSIDISDRNSGDQNTEDFGKAIMEMGEVIRGLLSGNSWLPLKMIRSKDGEHWTLYMVNTGSLYCLDRYFSKC